MLTAPTAHNAPLRNSRVGGTQLALANAGESWSFMRLQYASSSGRSDCAFTFTDFMGTRNWRLMHGRDALSRHLVSRWALTLQAMRNRVDLRKSERAKLGYPGDRQCQRRVATGRAS
jgi:hypothetical protein